MKSKDWVNRQKKDFYVNKAKAEGYVSRAAFKIIEIEKKFKLIEKSKKILELGSSPGGWSQAIFEINKNANVYGFDLLEMKFNHPQFKFFQNDFLTYDYLKIPYKFDLILSDIAPNTIGHQSTDHLRIVHMIEEIIFILDDICLVGSSFVFKLWKGNQESLLIGKLKKKYKKISYFKPKSSRSESSEIYIIAQNFK